MEEDFDFFTEITRQYVEFLLTIPAEVLSSTKLSFNEKLLLGLDYTFKDKLGFNILSHKEVGILFNIHPNIVSYCRKNLLKNNYLTKEKRKYYITDKVFEEAEITDKRSVVIPHIVYNLNMPTGAKLLWGECNSFSMGVKYYYAYRDFTAKRLNASKESITNWTKILAENGLIALKYRIGYSKNEKYVKTCKFGNRQ